MNVILLSTHIFSGDTFISWLNINARVLCSEGTSSIFAQDTYYPDWSSHTFPQALQAYLGIVTQIEVTASLHMLSKSLFTNPFVEYFMKLS
jgi:hypothetical protein